MDPLWSKASTRSTDVFMVPIYFIWLFIYNYIMLKYKQINKCVYLKIVKEWLQSDL